MGAPPSKIGNDKVLKASWLDTLLGPMLAIADEEAFYKQNGFEPLFELNTYGPDFKMVYLYKKLGKNG